MLFTHSPLFFFRRTPPDAYLFSLSVNNAVATVVVTAVTMIEQRPSRFRAHSHPLPPTTQHTYLDGLVDDDDGVDIVVAVAADSLSLYTPPTLVGLRGWDTGWKPEQHETTHNTGCHAATSTRTEP